MNIELDEKFSFKIDSDFTIQGLRYSEPIEIDNFGLAAAHKVCELKNYVDDLERMLLEASNELALLIDKENERLKSNISSTDLDPPEYLDYQTVHEAMKLLNME